MRLRLIALSALLVVLLMIVLFPLVPTQAQQSLVNDSERLINNNGGNALRDALTLPFPILGFDPIAQDDKALCWKRTYTRGAGVVPTGECPAGQEKNAGLCYPVCRAGFKGVGPVCWRSCPDNFRDDGAYCAKPAAYGRGGGYPWQFGDPAFDLGNARRRCEGANGGANTCEQDGAIWYPKCKAGFVKVGCCVCSPACPAGMTDIGVSCQKETYGRGVGQIPGCGPGLVLDAGLCYPPAAQGFVGIGPVAWGKCPTEFPFECGAGCAKNQASCATAVMDMTLNTVGVAINILSFVAGGPGITAAAQNAAKQFITGTGRNYAQMGMYEALKTTAKVTVSTLKLNSKGFAKEFIKAYAKNKFLDAKNVGWMSAGLLKSGGLFAANQAAKEFGGLKTTGDFDWTILTALDPTGISSMVTAFTKYGNCSSESFLADVDALDFGTLTTPMSEVKTVNLSMQQPTTITEITTTPFTGAIILADCDCVGKVLQVGQKCVLKVRVMGKAGLEGAVQIYTTEYDVIPFVIGVKANPNAAPALPVAGVDDAVNVTAVVGVWAWNKDQSKKVIVQTDGTAQNWAGSKGTVFVKDPNTRIFDFIWDNGRTVETLSLSEDRQDLTGIRASVSAVRRTWDARCKPGEMLYAGLCYDIPPDYEPTAPGFMGKPCQLGWRDDGTSCWPDWKGVDVAAQASRTGTFKNPLVVTDCSNYSTQKGQRCPVNFKNSGGPLGCSCEAQPTSKEVKSIIGTIPR